MRMRALAPPAVVVSLSSLACTTILSLPDVPDSESPEGDGSKGDGREDPSSACGLSYGTPTCAQCALSHCCSQSNACAADPVCAPYESCLGNCHGDPACRSRCVMDQPSGTSAPVGPLSACLATQCETECGLVCGGLAAYETPPGAAEACQVCLVKNACADARACASSAECEAVFQQCNLACSTWDCVEACQIAHGALTAKGSSPDGGAYTSFIQDWGGACSTAKACARIYFAFS